MKNSEFLGLVKGAEPFDETIHTAGYSLSAAATQEGLSGLDTDLHNLLAAFDLSAGPTPNETILIGLVRQLATVVAMLAKTSTHPHAEALRSYRTLIDLRAQQLPDEASAWLQRKTALDEIGARISAILDDGNNQ